MNRIGFLVPVTLLFAGCESGGTKSSPLQLTDSLLQALVKGNGRTVTGMFMTSREFKSIMKCEAGNELIEGFGAMVSEQTEALSALAKGARPDGFMAEVVEFEIADRDFEPAGSEQGSCVLSKSIETAKVKFKYKLGTTPMELQAFPAERERMELVNVGSRWVVVEGPEMEAFGAFATVTESSGSALKEHQLRACRAEVPSNVKAIKESQEIFNAEQDYYLPVTAHPTAFPPGKNAQSWGYPPDFSNLNWAPDGDVRGVYSVTTTAPNRSAPGGDFKVIGRIDCDGDGVPAIYTATKSINVSLAAPNDVF